MNRIAAWLFLGVGLLGGCGREIFYVKGCQDRLAIQHKIDECLVCVQRPIPHVYLPDQPDGVRCQRR